MNIRHVNYALGVLVVIALVAFTVWAAFALRTTSSRLLLETTPDRASAYVDGNFIGTTPLTRGELTSGHHVVRVTKFGYTPLLREVELEPGENPFKFNLVELPGGTLDVTSTPPGAEVIVDGEPRGQTPLTLRGLSTGGHRIRLSLINYQDWTGPVEIEDDKTARLDITLTTRTEGHYLAAIKADPDTASHYVDLGHYYIVRGEWEKAEDAFTNALVLTASGKSVGYATRLNQELDKVFGAQFDYDNVPRGQEVIINALLEAIRKNPTYLPHYGLAINYATRRNMTAKAQEILETGIVTFPYNQNWTVSALERQFRGQRNRDRTLSEIEKRIKETPDDFVSHFQRMSVLRQQGETDEVIKEYEHLCRLAKSELVRGRLLGELGGMWERTKDYVKAAEAYRQAVKLEPTTKGKAPVQYNLVRVLELLERDDETITAWEKAVEYQENVEVACRWRLRWAQLCIKAGRNTQARRILDDVLKLSKDDKTREQVEPLMRQITP